MSQCCERERIRGVVLTGLGSRGNSSESYFESGWFHPGGEKGCIIPERWILEEPEEELSLQVLTPTDCFKSGIHINVLKNSCSLILYIGIIAVDK